MRRVRVTTVALEKQKLLHTLDCMSLAVVIQHAKHMRRITVFTRVIHAFNTVFKKLPV